MKTDEQLRDELAEKAVRGKNGQFSTIADWDAADLWKQGWIAARANPPRVEGFPESECRAAITPDIPNVQDRVELTGISWKSRQINMFIKGARWMHDRMKAAPDEREGLREAIESLDGAAAEADAARAAWAAAAAEAWAAARAAAEADAARAAWAAAEAARAAAEAWAATASDPNLRASLLLQGVEMLESGEKGGG